MMSDPSTSIDAPAQPGGTSRRGLLGTSLAALAAVPVVGMLGSTASAAPQQSLDEPDREAFTDLQIHENGHVAYLRRILGTRARPKPTFRNLDTANFDQFAERSRVFANTGVGALLGAAPLISSKQVLAIAGALLGIESRHAGFLNVFRGRDVTTQAKTERPVAFDLPLSASEVAARVAPFIADLNGGPPLTITPGDDTSILNFTLVLDHLEAEFFNLNVPKYF